MLLFCSVYFVKNKIYKLNNSTSYQYKKTDYNLSLKKKSFHSADVTEPLYYIDVFISLYYNIFFNDSAQSQDNYLSYLCQLCEMTLSNSNSLLNYTFNYHNMNTYSSTTQKTNYYVNYIEHTVQNIVVIS